MQFLKSIYVEPKILFMSNRKYYVCRPKNIIYVEPKILFMSNRKNYVCRPKNIIYVEPKSKNGKLIRT